MTIHSNLSNIVEDYIGENEELESLKRSLGEIEREINRMAERSDAVLESVLDRAKELIERRSGHKFISSNWHNIEHSLRKNLDELEEKK